MAEIDAYLTRLETMLREARAVPMSASAMVHRDDALDLLDEVRRNLPRELDLAQKVLADRDAAVAEGREQAKALIDSAYAERTHLVSQHEVARQADVEAQRIVHEAETTAEQMRRETDDYVDHKLANFEVMLDTTRETVHRGRETLAGRRAKDQLGDLDPGPLPGVDDVQDDTL